MSDANEKPKGEDFMIPLPRVSEDAPQMVLRHREDHSTEVMTLLPTGDGKPLPPGAELIHCERDKDNEMRYNVKSLYQDPRKGPSRVATKQYRDGWDTIFSKKPDPKAN